MKKELQDDISALCSLVNLDRAAYREFNRSTPNQSQIPNNSFPSSEKPDDSELLSTGNIRLRSHIPELVVAQKKAERRVLKALARTGPPTSATDNTQLPLMCVLSAAGGSGATTVTAALAVLCCRRSEDVLIIDGQQDAGILPVYFGGRLGAVSTDGVMPVHADSHGTIGIRTIRRADPDAEGSDVLIDAVSDARTSANRVIIDAPAHISDHAFSFMVASGLAVVVAVPDLRCVIGAERLAKRLRKHKPSFRPVLVLNKFDRNVGLHVEILQLLKNQFADQFHYLAISRGDQALDALAEGLTVFDLAPECAITHDLKALAAHIFTHTATMPHSRTAPSKVI